MSPPRDTARRDELLAAVVDTFADRGLGSRSLRDIAAEVGTSHRMLLHHFGSRDLLMVAVVQEVEARQAALLTSADGSPGEVVTRAWAHLRDPSLRPFERLFFETYARAANGEVPFDQFVPGAVDAWLRPAPDGPPDPDPALTRLGLAVVRGLLLDLVATGAIDETTAALDRFVELLERPARPAPPSGRDPSLGAQGLDIEIQRAQNAT
ncbi:MAG: TetR/AcrR family transcriptional regulator [Ilumatobacteraceae bacterium]